MVSSSQSQCASIPVLALNPPGNLDIATTTEDNVDILCTTEGPCSDSIVVLTDVGELLRSKQSDSRYPGTMGQCVHSFSVTFTQTSVWQCTFRSENNCHSDEHLSVQVLLPRPLITDVNISSSVEIFVCKIDSDYSVENWYTDAFSGHVLNDISGKQTITRSEIDGFKLLTLTLNVSSEHSFDELDQVVCGARPEGGGLLRYSDPYYRINPTTVTVTESVSSTPTPTTITRIPSPTTITRTPSPTSPGK